MISAYPSVRGFVASLSQDFVLFGLFIMFAGCASLPEIKTPIHQSARGKVSLHTTPDETFHASHPMTVDPVLLAHGLRGLHVQEDTTLLASLIIGEGDKIPVSNEQEIQFLIPRLAAALSKATAEEYVWFQVASPKGSEVGATTGVMYIVNDFLRIGLQEFQSDHRYRKLSSNPSYSPKHIHRWALHFTRAIPNTVENSESARFPVQAKIGTVTIALSDLERFQQSSSDASSQGTPSEHARRRQEIRQPDMEALQEEIGELHKTLKEQRIKLKHLEERMRPR